MIIYTTENHIWRLIGDNETYNHMQAHTFMQCKASYFRAKQREALMERTMSGLSEDEFNLQIKDKCPQTLLVTLP